MGVREERQVECGNAAIGDETQNQEERTDGAAEANAKNDRHDKIDESMRLLLATTMACLPEVKSPLDRTGLLQRLLRPKPLPTRQISRAS